MITSNAIILSVLFFSVGIAIAIILSRCRLVVYRLERRGRSFYPWLFCCFCPLFSKNSNSIQIGSRTQVIGLYQSNYTIKEMKNKLINGIWKCHFKPLNSCFHFSALLFILILFPTPMHPQSSSTSFSVVFAELFIKTKQIPSFLIIYTYT